MSSEQEKTLRYSPMDQAFIRAYPEVADEEVVIYHIMRRDRTPVRDRLTPRMEARQIIDSLDGARNARASRS